MCVCVCVCVCACVCACVCVRTRARVLISLDTFIGRVVRMDERGVCSELLAPTLCQLIALAIVIEDLVRFFLFFVIF